MCVPIWPLAVPFAGVAAWGLWPWRVLPPGQCACGYDLAGIEGACPECGREVALVAGDSSTPKASA
jgi:hypothetical protein